MDDKEEFWHNIQKEYLTTEQKLAIIRDYNRHLSEKDYDVAMRAVLKYIDDNLLIPPKNT